MLKPVESSAQRATRKALAELPRQVPDPTRIAVLLNKNARRVSDGIAKRAERIVGGDHFFYSHNLEEAEAFSREIVQRGYGTVVCGGGDGTLCRAINLIQRYIDESNAWRAERYARYGEVQTLLAAPRFAILRLGTGNGMTGVVGAKDALKDLKRVVDYAPGRTHTIDLIEHDGDKFFFGGMGYDSLILNDYNALKERTHNRLFKPFMHTVGGYFAALFARTLPRAIFHNRSTKIEGRVVNQGKAYYVDPRRGDAVEEIEPGTTLFEGLATIITASTSPYFGYGFKMFPFANMMPGMMQLRVGTIGPFSALANLGSIWRGHYRNPSKVMDFLVEDVRIELERPFPFQHSGDAQGLRREVEMRISDEPLRLVDYYPPRPTF